MSSALVTGANGFIGSHLVRKLLDEGYDVRGLVRSTSDLRSLEGLPITLFLGDVRDRATLIEPVRGADYVFHLAAELMVASADQFLAANTRGTRNLLEVTQQEAGSDFERFLFVSSQAAAGPAPDRSPIDESVTPTPISWYGTSKMRAEEIAREDAGDLPVTIVRPASVYGERERDISGTFSLVERRLQPRLGLRTRYVNMVYVGDVVRALIMAAESDAAVGETYFLNHPEELTLGEVVETMGEAAGKSAGLRLPVPLLLVRLAAPAAEMGYHFTHRRPAVTRDKVREISQKYWLQDPSKAERDFGWSPRFDLLEGLKKTMPWFGARRARVRALEGERGLLLWLQYLIVGAILGAVIESTSRIGQFYTFDPGWGVFVIILGAFGIGLGTLAMVLRRRGDFVQFVVGTAANAAVEALNLYGWLPGISWTFAEAWPFGITTDWIRLLVVSAAGGLFVVIINAVMRYFYRVRRGT